MTESASVRPLALPRCERTPSRSLLLPITWVTESIGSFALAAGAYLLLTQGRLAMVTDSCDKPHSQIEVGKIGVRVGLCWTPGIPSLPPYHPPLPFLARPVNSGHPSLKSNLSSGLGFSTRRRSDQSSPWGRSVEQWIGRIMWPGYVPAWAHSGEATL